jgi:colanic acid/amylovoran biosynthesis glycosyltransferase
MRICLIVRQFPALSETFVANQALGLLRLGHEVVIVPERITVRDTISAELRASGLLDRVVRHPAVGARWSTRVSALASLIPAISISRGAIVRASVNSGQLGTKAKAKTLFWAMRLQGVGHVDIIHTQFGPCALFAVAARRAGLMRAPIVSTVHGTDVTALPHRRGHDMYREAFDDVDAITVGSEYIARVVTTLGAAPQKVKRIPQGVDTGVFAYQDRRGRDDEPFTLVTVGRLVEVKGVDVALRAFAAARDRVPDLRYLIVGRGRERPVLERLAADLGVDEAVTFLGEQDRAGVLSALERADVFLLSGVHTAEGAAEGQGLAVLEAMATGLPAMVSGVGGLAESVQHQETGFIVAERDVEGLAQRIVEMASDRRRCLTMGRAASMDIRERFSLASQLERLEGLYAAVLASDRVGDRVG